MTKAHERLEKKLYSLYLEYGEAVQDLRMEDIIYFITNLLIILFIVLAIIVLFYSIVFCIDMTLELFWLEIIERWRNL